MKNLKNKKGADKILSVYWFAILFIVAAAIIYIVVVFYGKPYDVRDIEADLLTDRIANCLSQNGSILDDWESLDDESFIQECRVTLDTEDSFGWNNDQIYLEVNFSDFNTENLLKQISIGNLNLKEFCSSEGESLPYCLERSFYVIDKENNAYKIDILSVIRKTEKNV